MKKFKFLMFLLLTNALLPNCFAESDPEALVAGIGAFVALLWIFSVVLYFVPSMIGWGKTNFAMVFILNLLLGWTIVGWCIAVIVAFQGKKKEEEQFDRLIKMRMLQSLDKDISSSGKDRTEDKKN